MANIQPKVTTNHSEMGSSNNRGNKGQFRPHCRGRGCGNIPLTNDYQTSASPLVGGQFSSFRREWLEENGYVLPFINRLFLARQPLILSGYKDHQKDVALASCIISLLTQ